MTVFYQFSPLESNKCSSPYSSYRLHVSVTRDRQAEVDHLLAVASRWAHLDDDIAALAVVGSWARSAQRMSSDVDLVVLTPCPDRYVRSDTWLRCFGSPPLVRTRAWGVLTERRVRLDSGLEVEFGFTLPAWAAVSPVDAGTRRIVSDGVRALYDPAGLLATLVAEVVSDVGAGPCAPPSEPH